MHSVLRRQLARLGLSPDCAPSAEQWRAFLSKVEASYDASDQDRALLERSLALSSEEMRGLYDNLRTYSEASITAKNRELELSLSRAEAVMESVADGILVVAGDGRVVAANSRFKELWSVSGEPEARAYNDLLCQAAAQLVDGERFLARTQELHASMTEHAVEELRLRDNRVFECFSGPVRSRSGERLGRIWSFRDVTEQRQLASERLLVTGRLAWLGRLTASVAHELNNPLAYVCTNIDLVREALGAVGPGAEKIDELLTDAQEGLQRITAIVRDIRRSSRTGDEQLEQIEIDAPLSAAIQMAANEIRHRAELVRDVQPALSVRADPARLSQVFLNLLVNAAHAISEGRREDNVITVRAVDEGGIVCVTISDTGAGIEAHNLERIFEPFFTTKPVGVGTGLGLSICRETIESYGGTIVAFSEPGRGTTFCVRLPRSAEPPRVAAQSPAPAARAGRPARILIIDDEPNILRALHRTLADPHEVVTCAYPRRAFELFEAGQRFDVILCDLMMPDMSGVEFHELMLVQYPEQAHRIVFMTGGALSARAEAFASEFGRVLRKPLRAREVRELVTSLTS